MKSLKILFVEDLPTDYELAEWHLRENELAFHSICVDTQPEFLKALDTFEPDLIISDYSMPEFNGLQALQLTLEHKPEIPFIILTGSINEETAVLCMKAGATDYVLKEKMHRLPFAVRETMKRANDRKDKFLAEKQLRESEAKFRDIFESANVGKTITTPDEITAVNKAFADMVGYSQQELMKLSWQDITPPEDIDWINAIVSSLEKGEQDAVRYDKRYIHKNGSYVWVDISVIVHRNQDGKPSYYISTIIDISQRKLTEKKLKASEEQYRLLIENQSDMIVKVDVEGRFLYVSPSYCRMFGKNEEELIGEKFVPLVHEEDLPPTLLAIEALNQPPHTGYIEQWALTKDGWRWLSWTDTAVLDAEGNIKEIIGLGTDITQRKETEQALRESETKFRSFFQNNLSVMLLIDPETGMITDANPAACRFYSYDKKTLVNTNISQINTLPQDDVFAAIKKAIDGEKNNFQFHHRLANGEIRDVEVNSSPIEHQGKKILFSLVRDITQKKQAEQQISLQATALKAAANAIVITDNSGAIKWVNPAYSQLTGYTFEEVLDKNPRILKSGMHNEAYYQNLWHTILSGQVWEGEVINKRKDGSLYTENETITPMVDEQGNVSHFIAIKEDITQRKHAEQALREGEERYRSLFEDSPVAIFEEDFSEAYQIIQALKVQGVTDFRKYFTENPDKLMKCIQMVKILDVNHAVVTLYKANNKKELLLSLAEFVPDKPTEYLLEEFVNIAEGKTHFQLETVNEDFQGNPIYLSIYLAVVSGHETDFSKVNVSVVDITDRRLSEIALKESETRFRMLFDQAPVGYQSLNEEGIFIDINQTWLDLLGYERVEVIGKRFGDFLAPNYVEDYKMCFTNFKEKGSTHSEFEMLKKDGSLIYVAFDGRIGFDERGQFKQTHCVMKDITESKRADKARKESENRYLNLFENSPVSIWEEDFTEVKKYLDQLQDSGVKDITEFFSNNQAELLKVADLIIVNDVNQETLRLFGAKSKEELKNSFTNIYTEKSLSQLKDELVNISSGKNNFDIDFTNKTLDGKVLEFSAKWVAQPGYENELSKVLISMIDITDRKKAEESLRENEQRYRSLFEDSPVAIFEEDFSGAKKRIDVLKQNGVTDFREYFTSHPEELVTCVALVKVTDVNQASLTLFGAQNKEQLKMELTKVIPPENPLLLLNEFVNIASGLTNFYLETINKDLEGRNLFLAVNWAAVPGFTEDLSQVIVTQVDITERKKAEESQLKRLAEMEAMDKITSALRLARTKEEALPIFLSATMGMMNVDVGSIWLFTPTTNTISISTEIGWPDDSKEISIAPGEGIVGSVFVNGETVVSAEFLNDPDLHPLDVENIRPGWGGICVPIHSQEETLGVILIIYPTERKIQPDDVKMLEAFARIAGITLQRMTLYEDTLVHLRQLQVQRTIDQTIASIFDLSLTLEIICTQICNHLSADATGVLLFSPHKMSLKYAASNGFRTNRYQESQVVMGKGPAGLAALNRKIIHELDITHAEPPFRNSILVTEEKFVSYLAVPLIAKGELKGIVEIFYRSQKQYDHEMVEFIESLALQTAIAIDNLQLFEDLQHSNRELVYAYDATIEGWSRAMDLRDKETENHTKRVTNMTVRMAQSMGVREEEITHWRRGALLHDIGKMGIPDEIMYKPGKLTPEEWVIMKQHPKYAYDMISPIEYLRPALEIPYCHHEKWDGTGYPRGLKGEQIPLAGRVFAVIDVWDALRSDRPYRDAWPEEKVLAYIKEQSGTHFEPAIVNLFLEIVKDDGVEQE